MSPQGAAVDQHGLRGYVLDKKDPSKIIRMPEGVYEYFIDVQLVPPELADGSIVDPDPNYTTTLSLGKFVICDTRPTITDYSVVVEDNTLNISGKVSSKAHDLALEHKITGLRITQPLLNAPPAALAESFKYPFTYERAGVLIDHTAFGARIVRPDEKGNFKAAVENTASEAAGRAGVSAATDFTTDVAAYAVDGLSEDWWLEGYIYVELLGRLTSMDFDDNYSAPPVDIELSMPGLTAIGDGTVLLQRQQGTEKVVDVKFNILDAFGSIIPGAEDDANISVVWGLRVTPISGIERSVTIGATTDENTGDIVDEKTGVRFNSDTQELTIPADLQGDYWIAISATLVVDGKPIGFASVDMLMVTGEVDAAVTGVSIADAANAAVAPLERGSKRVFAGVPTGAAGASFKSDNVIWLLSGSESFGTSINMISGELAVDMFEPADYLTVTALAVGNINRRQSIQVPLSGNNVDIQFNPPAYVVRGRQLDLTAYVVAVGDATPGVQYSITGIAESNLTQIGIGGSTAQLRIGSAETASSVTVTVTSLFNKEVSVSCAIKITDTAVPGAGTITPQGVSVRVPSPLVIASSAPGTPAYLLSSGSAHTNNVIKQLAEAPNTDITAESMLAQIQAGLGSEVNAVWSRYNPFKLVMPSATAPGRITGTIVLSVGNSATAVLVIIELPQLDAQPQATQEPEPEHEPELEDENNPEE